jgi:hypothetical protein
MPPYLAFVFSVFPFKRKKETFAKNGAGTAGALFFFSRACAYIVLQTPPTSAKERHKKRVIFFFMKRA